jgi:hypothetical protein
MDGFTPFSRSSTLYSCWPVFMMPYNLPPTKCMKEDITFLALVIPSPKDPCAKINVFMQSLIEELKVLWQGVEAYDSHLNCRFNLRAAYLWSIHDLLAYDIWCGWCVHGRMCCPICMGGLQAYRLKHGKRKHFLICTDVSFSPIILLGKIQCHFGKAGGLEMGIQSDKQVKI